MGHTLSCSSSESSSLERIVCIWLRMSRSEGVGDAAVARACTATAARLLPRGGRVGRLLRGAVKPLLLC